MEEKTKMGQSDFSELARMLRCPMGTGSEEMARMMYQSNKGMILDSLASLRLKDRNRVLEIGHGNGAHVGLLLKQAEALRYFGLDISQAMVDEAKKINKEPVLHKKALFQQYNGNTIPYVRHFFDRILTVNTIYFWEDPKKFLRELYRVLKPGGICVITFVAGNFMRKLPFVDDTFTLYDIKKLEILRKATHFKLVAFHHKSERMESKSGEKADRDFTIAILRKATKILRISKE